MHRQPLTNLTAPATSPLSTNPKPGTTHMNDFTRDIDSMLNEPISPKGIFPDEFKRIEFDLGMLDREPRPMELLDGHLIPKGAVTLIATDPGSGKSTSAIVSCINASYDGSWSMLGKRKHEDPLRCMLILGEDSDRSFEASLASFPDGTKEKLRIARSNENLLICTYDKLKKMNGNKDIFDKEGKLTEESGDMLIRLARKFYVDVLVLDTIFSLSECDYLSRNNAYNTIGPLSDIAVELNCAVIVMMHLTKEGGSAIKASVKADELTNKVAGSAGWKGATRHMLALVECPRGLFDNITADENDEKWIVAVKTNLIKDAAKTIFPVIRSSSAMMLQTTDEVGTPLLETENEAEAKMQRRLRSFVTNAVRASSELRNPFAQLPRNKFSIGNQMTGSLIDIAIPATIEQYEKAVWALEKMGKIVTCKTSRSGGGLVWDTPDGAFAKEAEFELLTGKKLELKKGALSAQAISDKIEDIKARNQDERSEMTRIKDDKKKDATSDAGDDQVDFGEAANKDAEDNKKAISDAYEAAVASYNSIVVDAENRHEAGLITDDEMVAEITVVRDILREAKSAFDAIS